MKKDVVGCKWFVEELYFGASQNCFQRVIVNLQKELIIVMYVIIQVIMEMFYKPFNDFILRVVT